MEYHVGYQNRVTVSPCVDQLIPEGMFGKYSKIKILALIFEVSNFVAFRPSTLMKMLAKKG